MIQNRNMIQNPHTGVCAEYCAVVLTHFHHFKNLRRVGLFNCDLLVNDYRILKFVTKSYRLNLALFPDVVLSKLYIVLSFV